MQGNVFQGKILSSLKALKSLRILDLSNNNISENIPRFFYLFHQIEYLILSHNKLRGEVPREGLFLNTSAFSVVGNSWLYGGRHGSVYKGVLELVELIITVKVLNVEVRGPNKSFLADCESLRNIRHRNLIKIIIACSSIDHKGNDLNALAFEFMTNGSLDSWFHPSPYHPQGNIRKLTLLQRLNIVIDVALGVDYLHHHSHASIIHTDIKSSNILLDEEFVAHIGDFGLARLSFAISDNSIEYGMGVEISAEGDVYSYRILLLEMFSGKGPTGSSNNALLEEYCERDLARRRSPQTIRTRLDEDIRGPGDFQQISGEFADWTRPSL
ncbi:putative LRR receptor-like serine/threonine-protein kinase At3g47570 [Apium graveolens]|uniref:putative LRR receptor-like serine/threonine-protein kinase At3g47570 n=1 Tax=Apium graveolens TaxID=4045 RepID=UPI003D78C626